MYDALVRSTLFGIRNADKVVSTNDKGRILADVGQLTNAAKAAAQLDNALGKGAQAAIEAMNSVAGENKALSLASKGAQWASNNVNPLLIGAAGYRILMADDKETALKKEIWGMSSMFAVEGAMKLAFKSNYANNIRGYAKGSKSRALIAIAEGVLFVLGSIAGSTAGYKLGEILHPSRKKTAVENKFNLEELQAKARAEAAKKAEETAPAKKADDIDESEYFALKSDKTLA